MIKSKKTNLVLTSRKLYVFENGRSNAKASAPSGGTGQPTTTTATTLSLTSSCC